MQDALGENQELRDEILKLGSEVNHIIPERNNTSEVKKYEASLQLLITSDNNDSASQIEQAIASNTGKVAVLPHACHIQFNSSSECFFDTTVQWFLLSFSRVLYTQFDIRTGAPHSAFSR